MLCKTTHTRVGKVCRKCNSRLKYESTGGCVKCTQAASRNSYRRFPVTTALRKQKSYYKNIDRCRDTKFRAQYNITLDDFNAMLEAQKGVCYICKEVCASGRQLCVDHDHKKKIVRGLLCVNCNRGIGNFRDDTALLKRALMYLRKNNDGNKNVKPKGSNKRQ
jgi:hypothetical protein